MLHNKLLSNLTVCLLAIFLLPLSAFAEDLDVKDAEYVFDGISYYSAGSDGLDSEGHLTHNLGVAYNGKKYSGDVVIPEPFMDSGMKFIVTEIGAYAFFNTYVTSLTLPSTVKSIYGYAIRYSDIEYMVLNCTTPPTLAAEATYNYSIKMYVPVGTRSAYMNADGWKKFGSIIELVDEFETDGIKYTVTGFDKKTGTGTCEVAQSSDGYSGVIEIPSSVSYSGGTYTVEAVGKNAFYKSDVTIVTLPSTVTEIKDNAFFGCSKLERISLPEGLKTIGGYAFTECTSLKQLVFPKSLEEITGESVMRIASAASNKIKTVVSYNPVPPKTVDMTFYAVSSNTKLIVPKGSEEAYKSDAEWGRFSTIAALDTAEVDGINYEFLGDYECYVISKDPRYTGSVTIPSTVTHNGVDCPVTAIKDNALCDCSDLTAVSIPSSVTTIGDKAFYGCSSLKEITIPASVTAIGKEALAGRSDGSFTIVEATTPPTTYGKSSKWNGVLIVPLESLDQYKAAEQWGKFGYIYGGTQLFYADGIRYLLTSDKTAIIVGHDDTLKGDLPIPTYVAYEGKNYNVTDIGANAFYDCSNIGVLTIPSSIKTVGARAFQNSSITRARIYAKLKTIEPYTFGYCGSLKEVNIPSTVTAIGDGAFKDASNLSGIAVPASVTHLGDAALYTHSQVPVTLFTTTPPTLVESGAYPFDPSLSAGVRIPAGTLDKYKNTEPFWNSCHYTEIPTSFTVDGIIYNVLSYDPPTCEVAQNPQCTGDVVIPETVTYEGVTYTVKALGAWAFSSNSITSVKIPSTVTELRNGALYKCRSLTRIDLPANLELMEDYAIASCNNVEEIVFPETTAMVGKHAMLNLTSGSNPPCAMRSVVSLSPTPPLAVDSAFQYIGQYITLYVPKGSEEKYRQHPEWGRFANIVGLETTFDKDGKTYKVLSPTNNTCQLIQVTDAAENCVIPETVDNDGVTYTVTRIGDEALNPSAVSVVVPQSVERIGKNVFTENVSAVTLFATTPPEIDESTFATSATPAVYVPIGRKTVYEASAYASHASTIYECYVLTVGEGGGATLTLPFDAIIPEGAEVYCLTGIDSENTVTGGKVEDNISANKPVLVLADPGEYIFLATMDSDISSELTNGLMEGTYIDNTLVPSVGYVLTYANNELSFVRSSGLTETVDAYQAYVFAPESTSETLRIRLGSPSTAISSPVTSSEETDGTSKYVYDLTGRRITAPTKPGLYIKNRRKVVVK